MVSSIDWPAVVRDGTGFFGRPGNRRAVIVAPDTRPPWTGAGSVATSYLTDEEARGATLDQARAVAGNLGEQGGDLDLVLACALYLSERSLDHVRGSAPSADLDTALNWDPAQERVVELAKFPEAVKELRARWATQAYEAIDFRAARFVDEALEALEDKVRRRLKAFGVAPTRVGRPDRHDFLHVFSGLAQHLKAATSREHYGELAALSTAVAPPLSAKWTEDSLRSGVRNYRTSIGTKARPRTPTTGAEEFSELAAELEQLRRRYRMSV